MNMTTKHSIFQEHLNEWLAARKDKQKRGDLVRNVSRIAKVHPKSVARSFRRVQLRDPAHSERRGRRAYYLPDVTAALKELWSIANEPCGENLHGMVSEYVRILRRDGLWHHSNIATGKLLAMSVATMKRRVGGYVRTRAVTHGKSATKASSILSVIPLRRDGWDTAPVGTLQVDTVAHWRRFTCRRLHFYGQQHRCVDHVGRTAGAVVQGGGGYGCKHDRHDQRPALPCAGVAP